MRMLALLLQAVEPKEAAKEVLARAAARGIISGVPVDLDSKDRSKNSKSKLRKKTSAPAAAATAEKKRSRPVTQSPRRSRSTATAKPSMAAVSKQADAAVSATSHAMSSMTNATLTHKSTAVGLTHSSNTKGTPHGVSPLALASTASSSSPTPNRRKPKNNKHPLSLPGPLFPSSDMNTSASDDVVHRTQPITVATQRLVQSQPGSEATVNKPALQRTPAKNTGFPPHRRGFKHPQPFR